MTGGIVDESEVDPNMMLEQFADGSAIVAFLASQCYGIRHLTPDFYPAIPEWMTWHSAEHRFRPQAENPGFCDFPDCWVPKDSIRHREVYIDDRANMGQL